MKLIYTPAFRVSERLLVLDRNFLPFSKRTSKKKRRNKGPVPSRLWTWPNAIRWYYVDHDRNQAIRESLSSDRDQALVAAWTRLGAVETWSPSVLADVLLILIETPFVESRYLSALPKFDRDSVDLRPWLCDREKTRELLSRSADQWDAALDQLQSGVLGKYMYFDPIKSFRPSGHTCPDLYALSKFGYRGDILDLSWTEFEIRAGLPLLRGGSIDTVRNALFSIEYAGETDPELLSRLQRFLFETNSRRAADWIYVAEQFPESGQTRRFLDWASSLTFDLGDPRVLPEGLIRRIGEREIRKRAEDLQFGPLYRILEKSLDPALLDDALTLADDAGLQSVSLRIPDKATLHPNLEAFLLVGKSIAENTGESPEHWNSGANLLLRLWETSLNSRALNRHIEREEWPKLETEPLKKWFRLSIRIARLAGSNSQVCRWISTLESYLRTVPRAHRGIATACLHSIFIYLDRLPNSLQFSSITRFTRTVSEGFDKFPEEACDFFSRVLERSNPNQQWAIGNLSRSAIKNLEHRFRNDVARDLITEAFEKLLDRFPEFDFELLLLQPKQFLDLLDSVGKLPKSEIDSVADMFRHHPAFDFDPRRIGLEAASCLVANCGADWPVEIFHDKLKLHIGKSRLLHGAMLDHYLADFTNRTAKLRIALANQHIEKSMSALTGGILDIHTVQLTNCLDQDNRRGMKRFVQALKAGNCNYRENHPANRGWIAQHGNLDLSLWLYDENHYFRVSVEGQDDLYIELETNPQEELKMGTYVGSCLSSGAFNSHSAVSNTLDVNKRVAYLRNAQGNLLARQLLAVSKEERLVAFCVYVVGNPSTTDLYKEAFRSFDHYVADLLGIPVNVGDSYTVEQLVVPCWYDDGAWNPDNDLCVKYGAATIALIPKTAGCHGLAS